MLHKVLLIVLAILSIFSTWNLTRTMQVQYKRFQENMFRMYCVLVHAKIVSVQAKRGWKYEQRNHRNFWRNSVPKVTRETYFLIKAQRTQTDNNESYTYILQQWKQDCMQEPKVGDSILISVDSRNPAHYRYDAFLDTTAKNALGR